MIVGLGTNRRLSSRIICHATHAWPSHAWIELDCKTAIHATGDGVIEEDLPLVWLAYPRMRRYELTGLHPAEVERGVRQARALLGRPYDWNVVSNGLALWWWYLTGLVIPPRRDSWATACSEVACLVLRSMPLQKTDQLDPDATPPGKLDSWLEGHPNFVEV